MSPTPNFPDIKEPVACRGTDHRHVPRETNIIAHVQVVAYVSCETTKGTAKPPSELRVKDNLPSLRLPYITLMIAP